MYNTELKKHAIALRSQGMSYLLITRELGINIPKSTLSSWFRGISLSYVAKNKILLRNQEVLISAREKALLKLGTSRQDYFKRLRENNAYLADHISNPIVAKIALIMLFLGEGGKSLKRSSVMFGNANPQVVGIFLKLLRECYEIDESKFRCTVQCRSDQNKSDLEIFWSNVTNIPLDQFYETRVDPRSIGKRTIKQAYKGVCRIDYLSAYVFHDILCALDVVMGP